RPPRSAWRRFAVNSRSAAGLLVKGLRPTLSRSRTMSTLYGEPVDAFSTTAAGISTRRQEARRHAPASFPRRTPDPVASHPRAVAIMFVDITGFPRLTERVDPAVVYRRVSPLLDDLVLHVHEHGGQVQQVRGDGFMAAFGLHSTHGDEAERAVRAGRAMLACGGTKPARLYANNGNECVEG